MSYLILIGLLLCLLLGLLLYKDSKEDFVTTLPLNEGRVIDYSGKNIHEHVYGPSYYKNPKLMTEKQRRKFLKKADFDKMTIQDYINWLKLNIKYGNKLNDHHNNIINKYNAAKRLVLEDIPSLYTNPLPPLNAQDEYEKYLKIK